MANNNYTVKHRISKIAQSRLVAITLLAAIAAAGCTFTHGTVLTNATPEQHLDRALTSSVRLAEASIEGGDYNTALHIYRRLVRENPHNVEISRALGNALLSAGALDEAEEVFRKSVEMDRESLEPMMGLGRVYLAKSDGQNAIMAFNEALKVDPHSHVARNGLAVALDHLGKHRDAQKIYRKLLIRRPSDLMIKSNLGLSLVFSSQFAKAISILTNVVTDPTAPREARHNLALAYGLAGRTEVATELEKISGNATDVNGNLKYYELMRRSLN